jgi:hypothetical protein
MRYDSRNALVEYCLNHVQTINFVTSCTNAEFATLHEFDVVSVTLHMR